MRDLGVESRLKKLIVAPSWIIVAIGSVLSYTELIGIEGTHYFAIKSNLFNKYFVKRGWLWFTVAFWLAVFSRRDGKRDVLLSSYRYAAATIWWVFFTQWLLGPPIMDRLFTATGGSCELSDSDNVVSTSKVCRGKGGSWSGGHDPSGHVFLLTLSSTVILFEFWQTLKAIRAGDIRLSQSKKSWAVLVIQALNYIMLFFTCVYFHSFGEKVTGFFAALVEVYFVYFFIDKLTGGAQAMHSSDIVTNQPKESEVAISQN